MINSKWLVYSVTDHSITFYVRVLQENYQSRLELPGARVIIKNNLNRKEAENFANILNKLKN